MEHEDVRANGNVSMRSIIFIWVCSGLLLALGGYLAYYFLADKSDGQPPVKQGPPPAVVTAATAEKQLWRSQLTSVGTVQAIQGINVTTEVAGIAVEIVFNAGAHVKTGELLVKLDTSTERAELRSLEARLEKARSDETRARQLVARNFISEANLQQTVTETRNLQAQVEQQQTRINKKNIRAPFAGKLGIRQISTGELISPGTPIVTLQSISPIHVNFTLPEHTFSKVFPGQVIEVKVAAYPQKIFKGKISAINPSISEKTRNFTVQALLSNSEGYLQPGMFADVMIDLDAQRQVIAVPVSAVTFNAYGESVFFVRTPSQQPSQSDVKALADQKPTERNQTKQSAGEQGQSPVMVAERGFIQTGEERGLMIEIVKGLKAGDRVVTAGQIKISDGSPIIISDDDVMQNVEKRPIEP